VNKRLLTYEDLRKVEYLSAPAIAPDGKSAVFVIQTAGTDGDFIPRVFEIDLETKNSRLLIKDGVQNQPAYSPDGNQIAYLGRKSPEDELQIWIYDRRTGTERKLTTMRHGVGEFAWSPDGSQIAYTAKWWPSDLPFTEFSPEEKADWEFQRKHSPIVIEKLMYKFDETYGLDDQSVLHVCTVDVAAGRMTSLTTGEVSYYRASWSSDGKRLAWYGKPYKHTKQNRPAIFLYDMESKSLKQLECGDMIVDTAPAIFTSDGKSLIFSCYVVRGDECYMQEVQMLSLGDGKVENLFPEEEVCHGVDSMPIGRTAYGKENPAYQLSRDGLYIYFLSGWDGCENIYRLPVHGDRVVEKVTDDKMSVHSFCAPVGETILYTRGDLLTIAELYIMDLSSKEQTRLTYSNQWLNDIELAFPHEMWVASKDGKVRIHGFVVPPANREEGVKYPAVLDIHGGPECFYAHDFWFEFQMLAARGFAVVYCDPRGSAGYGSEFGSGKYAWGQESMDDLMSFLDAAIELGFIDADRLGVTGGSYGGHMTNRIIGAPNRFKAAVTQRTLCNLATSYGTGDMGFIWKEQGMQTQMKNFMSRAERSPITKIDNMKTPLLILHATNDYRCSFEQGEQLFIAMKDRNPEVPVRLVAFPGENHGMTREGKVHFQIAHLREMAQWFERFLKSEPGEKGEGESK